MSSFDALAKEICLNVQEQARVWQRMLELSLAQLAALGQQDVHAVHAVLQEIEIAMLDRSRAESRRTVLMAQAASKLDMNVADITRELIMERCDPATGAELSIAADELRALVVELDSVVARNTAMLEQELSIIEVLVRGVTVDTSVRTTYGKQGMQQEAPRLRLLDAQV
ncbi:MAG: flagellar export chaperone FlgN [Gaiellales bacterium]